MGCRSLTCVVLDGEYKVAEKGYRNGDYFCKTVLEFIQNNDMELFKDKLRSCSFISDEEYDELNVQIKTNIELDPDYDWQSANPQLHGKLGSSVLQYIYDCADGLKLNNELMFAGNSLFCEYGYVIDFDKNVFETYIGFNTSELGEEDRFYGFNNGDSEHEPIYLVAEYPLDKLPTMKQMWTDLHGDPYH